MQTINRRQFLVGLAGTGLAAGLVQVPGLDGLVRMAEASAATVPAGGPLVLCTLFGGNDGLNTVVPYESGIYRDWRKGLAVQGALPLGEQDGVALGFHPAMTALQSLFHQGKVAVISGVEYPNPNFSHFESEYIWQTTDLSGQEDGSGWIGRWLDRTGTDPFRALSVGPTLPPAFVGTNQQATALMDSTSVGSQVPTGWSGFDRAYRRMMSRSGGRNALENGSAEAGRNMLRVGDRADAALASQKPPAVPGGRDAGDIGTQLQLVAELIKAGMPTSVYGVSQASYDTHANQSGTHASLLGQLDAAMATFMSAFPTAAPGKSPVVVIYSEFGRTPKVNSSQGTDHSSASVVLAVGPNVRGGFYGAVPSFTRLDRYGNLKYTTDFRSVYGTVLESCLGIETPRTILKASKRTLGFVR